MSMFVSLQILMNEEARMVEVQIINLLKRAGRRF